MKPAYLEHRFQAMGSPCELKLYAPTRSRAEHQATRVVREVARLESRYSRYRPTSLLSEINRVAARGGGISLDEETAGLIDYVDTCYRESGGLFDITSGILRRAWNFKTGEMPEPSLIHELLDRVGWAHVTWQRPRLEFLQPGLELDLGGAVKEYAVDRVVSLCWEGGVHHGLVNLGGDLKVIGPHPDGSPWRIGVRHPRDPSGFSQTLSLAQGAMASSGDYERCIEIDGVRYGHVLNPRTGWPVSHLASVSVIAELCVVAGSAATIAMLKEQEGAAWLQRLGLPHYWVDLQGVGGGSLS